MSETITPAEAVENWLDISTSSGETGTVVLNEKTMVLVDGHMHIMSLNGTPLQLQWATPYIQDVIPFFIGGSTRQSLYTLGAVASNVVKIGRFSTDLIARIFMGEAKNDDMKQTLAWLVSSSESSTDNELGENVGLESLSDKQKNSLNDFFTEVVPDYYKGYNLLKMCIALPMDLSYASFWGLHRLPMIFNHPKNKKQLCYISDYRTMGQDVSGDKILLYEFGNINKPERLLWDVPIGQYYEKFKDKIIENFSTTSDIYVTGLMYTFNRKKIEDKINELPDTSGSSGLNEIWGDLDSRYLPPNKKKYFHLMEETPGDNTEIFEDYFEQLYYHAASAYRFPLKILPFYHYDPRRHYYGDADKDKIINHITEKHDFIILEKFDPNGSTSDGQTNFVNLKAIYDIQPVDEAMADEAITMDYTAYFKDLFFNGVVIDEDGEITQEPLKREIQEAKHFLLPKNSLWEQGSSSQGFPKGLFWGVKMYPALGYPPDIYTSELTEDRFGFPPDFFIHLKYFYNYCQLAGVPITTHCGPLGMTIGDAFNYLKNDYEASGLWSPATGNWSAPIGDLKDNLHDWKYYLKPKTSDNIPNYDKKESVLHIDNTCARPLRWKKVLEDHPKLKLNLAHYGGGQFWIKPYNHDTPGDIGNINESYNFSKTEGLVDWRYEITQLILDYENVYTDISCYVFEHKKFEDMVEGNIYDLSIETIVDKVAENLLTAMNKADESKDLRLFHRIMMGTDWYMTEMNQSGTEKYFRAMFGLLQKLSNMYEKNIDGAVVKYDLWHQFSVVNPLQFLGILKEDSNGVLAPVEVFTDENGQSFKHHPVNKEKLIRYLDNLDAITSLDDNDNWANFAGIESEDKVNFTYVKEQILPMINAMGTGNDKLLILTAEQMKKRDNGDNIENITITFD